MLYSTSWTQPYTLWVQPEVEILDLTEAREILAKIMSKN